VVSCVPTKGADFATIVPYRMATYVFGPADEVRKPTGALETQRVGRLFRALIRTQCLMSCCRPSTNGTTAKPTSA
jgi:hypothetical protein